MALDNRGYLGSVDDVLDILDVLEKGVGGCKAVRLVPKQQLH